MKQHPIATRHNLFIGERRVFLDCVVHVLGSYTLPESERNKAYGSGTVFRHVFKTPIGPVVYTGKNLHLKQGEKVALCGTVKRFEHWGRNEQLRLSRVKVIEKPAQILMDF